MLGVPAGKSLALMLGKVVRILRRFGALDIDDDTGALLSAISAAIDCPVAPESKEDE
ncbi:hypothetical protein HMPREF0591_1715 [Mycobacterium parascrofulaceum ATCC BAA-614]|uniref:Uncharacterized protein n=1 Tax=Mycobacterium parascrofulaceum ATCC BAA-614 TaxID=525368 RepID=D5P6C1_9MYCO|nr:hypothetical protein [Mycobacterium parascrofulaceum]EFG78377.1 hypothetical protein HMPREF0591_1715 [Mycobacterium parascrofulaceum ATCC BAA-614]